MQYSITITSTIKNRPKRIAYRVAELNHSMKPPKLESSRKFSAEIITES